MKAFLKFGAIALVALSMVVPASAAIVVIDPFLDGQSGLINGNGAQNYGVMPVAPWTRQITVNQISATLQPAQTSIFSTGGFLSLSASTSTDSDWLVHYSTGTAQNFSPYSYFFLGAQTDLGFTYQLRVNGVLGNAVTQTGGNLFQVFVFPFAQFVGVDWANLVDIQLIATNTNNTAFRGSDVTFNLFAASDQVPEPATYALMAAGLGALALLRRRRA